MADMLRDKVAIVTGSGRGVGRGVAKLMAAEGASVVVVDPGVNVDGTGFNQSIAEEVVAEIRNLANELDGEVWVERVVLDVAAPVDVAALRRSGDLVGDLLQTIDVVSSDDQELATLAEELRPLGLKASLELSQAGIDLEDPDRLRHWLRQAEGLLVSHLLEVER